MNILIFRTGQLGDTLVSLPAIRSIKAAFPNASLYLLHAHHVGKQYVSPPSLLEGAGLFAGFIEYPVGATLISGAQALFARLKLMRDLRSYHFDKVFHLEPSYKTAAQLCRDKGFFKLAGVGEQITTLQFRETTALTSPSSAQENEVAFFVRALSSQGVPAVADQNPMSLCLGVTEAAEVTAWLQSEEGSAAGAGLERQLPPRAIGVGLGSKMQSKRWPAERYKQVIRRLVDSDQIVPVYFGGAEDAGKADQLISELGLGLNACGELSLRGSASALQECSFYLGNDTGTMHLAVAAGISCVGIFSARDAPGKWYPYGAGHHVHRVAVECEGCMLCECIERNRVCLSEISADEVYTSCVQILNQ